jgi:predicted nucleotidyltransferase
MPVLLGSTHSTLDRLILHFLVHPRAGAHFQALRRRLGVGARPLRAALDTLAARGLIRMERVGNRSVYHPDEAHAGWAALRQMQRAFGDPADVLREAFADLPGLEAAFLFGSLARGDAHADSDADVLLIGTEMPRRDLGRRTLEASSILGRDVNVVRFTPEGFRERARSDHHFVRSVLEGPRSWLVGDESWLGEVQA